MSEKLITLLCGIIGFTFLYGDIEPEIKEILTVSDLSWKYSEEYPSSNSKDPLKKVHHKRKAPYSSIHGMEESESAWIYAKSTGSKDDSGTVYFTTSFKGKKIDGNYKFSVNLQFAATGKATIWINDELLFDGLIPLVDSNSNIVCSNVIGISETFSSDSINKIVVKIEDEKQEKGLMLELIKSGLENRDYCRIHGYEAPPEIMFKIQPQNPDFVNVKGIQYEIYLDVEVLKDGSVGRINLLDSDYPYPTDIKEAAINAVKKWKFKPAMDNGIPIDWWVRFPVSF
jgi:TonB family protein